MKKKGRMVIEAAYIVPGLCILFCSLIFFTLYSHDYAVCRQTVLESGIKGLYEEGKSNIQIENQIRNDLAKKLGERMLWASVFEQEVTVNAVQIKIKVTAKGRKDQLPVDTISVQQTFLRVHPDQTIRISNWLKR